MLIKDLFEGRYDKYTNKAIFMCGGPGSGKSYITKILLSGYGLKLVNSDIMFTQLMKKAEISLTPTNIATDMSQTIRNIAKSKTAKQEQLYTDGKLGLIIDGTGRDYTRIQEIRERMVTMGYDTAMVFVNTSLRVARQRNADRDRSVPEDGKSGLIHAWKAVQNNLMKYQQLFGNDKFFIIDNSTSYDTPSRKEELNIVSKQVRKFLNAEIPRRQ